MILGTYWYFDFPTDLYKFDYFEFKKGYGGHADNPAEITTTFETKYHEEIICELKKLVEKYSDGFLYVYLENNKLRIEISEYQIFDYDFLLIYEVEKVLNKYAILLTKNLVFNNPSLIKIYNPKIQNNTTYPKKGFLQIVGSELKNQNAENSKLRLDCNIDLINKQKFIDELKEVANEEKIDIFFYYDKDFTKKTNLMLFFTNGRQGLNLTNKKHLDILSFENKIEKIIILNNANIGHIKEFDFYPRNGPKIEKMIEEEFIL